MNEIFLYYNYPALLCNHCLDFPKNYYEKMGLFPKHNFNGLNTNNVKKYDLIFVKNDLVENFFQNYYKNIREPFFLFSGNGGFDIGHQYKHYLNEGKILMWFGTNILWQHPRVFKLPIGFEELERCVGGTASCGGKHEGGDQNTLTSIYNARKKFEDKKHKIMVTHMGLTHPSRKHIKDFIDKNEFVEMAPCFRFDKYMENINEYKFVLCPRGNGTDTHRFWEVLLNGSVPIVDKNGINDLQDNFPCIIVNSYDEITKETIDNFVIDKEKFKNIDRYLKIQEFNKMITEKINECKK